MVVKLFAKSKNMKMLKVGTDAPTAKWYFMTEEIMKVAPSFSVGDEITIAIQSMGGSDFITQLSNGGDSINTSPQPPQQTQVTGAVPDEGFTKGKSTYLPKDEWIAQQKAKGLWKEYPKKDLDRGTDVNNSIKRQAIGHMTSRTLNSMQGIITPDNVEEMMTKIYNKYVELVG